MRRHLILLVVLILESLVLGLAGVTVYGQEFPQAVNVPPLRQMSGLYHDPTAHSPQDLDGPHENTHGTNSRIRNAWAQKHGGRWNACYVLRDKAFVIQEPPLTLTDVARAIPQQWRGGSYNLYLVYQAREWNDCPLNLMDEFSAYLNGLECDLATTTPHSSPKFQYQYCREFQRYAQVLSRLVHDRCPNYDARQLDAVIVYQSLRLHTLGKRLK